MTAARGVANPSYKLTQLDRAIIAALVGMDLWTRTSIAQAYGVTRKTVQKCAVNYGGELALMRYR